MRAAGDIRIRLYVRNPLTTVVTVNRMAEYEFELPTEGRWLHRSFCGRPQSDWLHTLDPAKVQFSKYGKPHSMSTWLALCQLCADAYQSQDDERALGRMMVQDSEWNIDWHMAQRSDVEFDLDESVGKPLRVVRDADLGARRLQ